MLGCLQQTALLILRTIIIGLLAAVDDTGDIDSIGLPKTRTVDFGPQSFSVAGPSLWNTLSSGTKLSTLTVTVRRFVAS